MYRSSIKKWQEQFMKPKGGRAMFSDWSYVTITPDEPIRPGPCPNLNYTLYDDYLDRVLTGNDGRYVPEPRRRKRHKRRTGEPNGSHASITGGLTANDSPEATQESSEQPKTSLLIDGFDKMSEEMMKPAENEEEDKAEAESEANDKAEAKPEEEDKAEANTEANTAETEAEGEGDDKNETEAEVETGKTAGLYTEANAAEGECDAEDYYYYTYSDSELEK